jgi:hypothetical protein
VDLRIHQAHALQPHGVHPVGHVRHPQAREQRQQLLVIRLGVDGGGDQVLAGPEVGGSVDGEKSEDEREHRCLPGEWGGR